MFLCFIHVCIVLVTTCGALDVLTRLGARTFLLLSHAPSWITQQISVEKCAHRGAPARQERQTMFKIVTWTKQTWTKHHNTVGLPDCLNVNV